jgi:hypothetical protein
VSPHQVSAPRKQSPPIFHIALLFLLLALSGVGVASSAAQSPAQDDAARPTAQERELDDRIPKHLPIKVKVKNLNSGKWMNDLEVEVTNTGEKPIYFIMFTVYFVDVKMENGDDLGFPLRYGRQELYLIENHAAPEDIPIEPGATYVFKAPESLVNNWEEFRAQRKMPHPKKIGIRFRGLNYGDGTGFRTPGGIHVPKPQTSD